MDGQRIAILSAGIKCLCPWSVLSLSLLLVNIHKEVQLQQTSFSRQRGNRVNLILILHGGSVTANSKTLCQNQNMLHYALSLFEFPLMLHPEILTRSMTPMFGPPIPKAILDIEIHLNHSFLPLESAQNATFWCGESTICRTGRPHNHILANVRDTQML